MSRRHTHLHMPRRDPVRPRAEGALAASGPVSLADVVERRVLGRSKPCNDINAALESETAAA